MDKEEFNRRLTLLENRFDELMDILHEKEQDRIAAENMALTELLKEVDDDVLL